MFAVITSPKFFEGIKQVIDSKGEQILFQISDTDVDINEEIEKVSRLLVKFLIVDITCLENEKDLARAIRKYRIRNESTRIIVLAPGYKPGNETISLLVTMGVWDIIAPEIQEDEEISIAPYLLNVLDHPTSYANAVRWDVNSSLSNNDNNSNKVKTKIKTQIKYIEKVEVESVFKKVIAVYSPTSEGTSRIAAHMAYAIGSTKKYKVLLMDFNPLKPIQKDIFNINFDYSLRDVLIAIEQRNLSSAVLESYTQKYNKNLHILCGLYDINDFYTIDKDYFEEIIEKAKFSYDYVIIDTASWYDVVTTDRALTMADDVVVPVRGRKSSLDTVTRYLKSFERYNDFNIKKFKVLVNKYCGNDLTFVEIESKLDYPVIGYISDNKKYDLNNAFKSKKLMNEYVPILKKIGINIKSEKSLFRFKKNIVKEDNVNTD